MDSLVPNTLPQRPPSQKRPHREFKKPTRILSGDNRPKKKRKLSDLTCEFKNSLQYKDYFKNLFFCDLFAKIYQDAEDQISRKRVYDALAVSFDSTSQSNSIAKYDAKIQTFKQIAEIRDMEGSSLLLLCWPNEYQEFENFFHTKNGKGVFQLPENHVLAFVRKKNQTNTYSLQLFLKESDHSDARKRELYRIFTATDNGKTRQKLKVIPLDSIQARMREYIAIDSIDDLHLRQILLNPSQSKHYIQHYDLWDNVPAPVKNRLQRNLNPSQLSGVEESCRQKGITLIQGPPGTGKTKTLIHLLNAMHISCMQKYYMTREKNTFSSCYTSRADKQRTARPAVSSDPSSAVTDLISGKGTEPKFRPPTYARAPKLLVCAPSNAAVDEIAQRLMEEDLVDGSGIAYKPVILRVGSSKSKTRQIVGELISLDAQVEAFMRHANDRERLNERIRMIENEQRLTAWNLKNYEQELKKNYKPYCKEDFMEQQILAHNYKGDIQRWAMMKDTLQTHRRELECCRIVQNNPKKAAEDKLKIKLMKDAEILFATLNMTGSKYFKNLMDKGKILFDYCIIDEAAQCTEPDILIPLQLGVKSLILVGDPQQLPATVFIQGDKAQEYERSMFERLRKAGMETHLLNTQYRMHPQISAFPSTHFYESKLEDGQNVQQPHYTRPYHQNPNFLPFLFFSLIDSKQQKTGHSWYNQTEAKFVVSHLEYAMSCFPIAIKKSSIGIITPYKEQKRKIENMLKKSVSLH